MEKKTSEAQLRASRAWAERNKEKRKIISLRGSARSFIRNWAQIEDLEELEGLIQERKMALEREKEGK